MNQISAPTITQVLEPANAMVYQPGEEPIARVFTKRLAFAIDSLFHSCRFGDYTAETIKYRTGTGLSSIVNWRWTIRLPGADVTINLSEKRSSQNQDEDAL